MTTRLVERLKKELTPQLQGYVAKTVGESPAATAKAADTAIATLFSGVAAAADTPDGLATLLRLVGDPVNDGTLLNQLPALYQGTMTAAPIYRLGSQLLHQVFGGKLGTVNQSIATLAGIKPSAAAVLTTTLAPHVLAIIGRDQRANGDLSAAGLARLLGGESAEVSAERGAAAAIMVAATGVGAGTANAAISTVREAGSGKPASSEPGSPVEGELSRDIPNAGAIVDNGSGGATLPPGRSGKVTRPAGSGAWLIFPAGFALGAALLGLGAIISDQVQQWPSGSSQQRTVVAAADVAPPQVAQVAPVAPAPVPPAQVKATVAPPPPAAAVPVAALAPSGPAVKPAAAPIAAPAPVAAPPVEAAPPTAAPPTAAAAPAKAPEPVAEPRRKPGPPGTTSFFGRGPVADLGPATMNPDYKAVSPPPPPTPPPAAAEVAPTLPPTSPAPPVAAVPAAPPTQAQTVAPSPPTPRVSPPGTTTYFGSAPTPPDKPVVFNPSYKPAIAAEVVATPPAVPVTPTAPTAPAQKAVQAAAPTTPPGAAPAARPAATPPPSGTTSYFGTAPGGPALPSVAINPEYKPAARSPLTAAAPIAPPARDPRAAGATLDLAGCRTAVSTAGQSGPVRFETSSAKLTRASAATLDSVARAFKSCATGKLKVEGHTDDRGAADYNLKLSEARARSVVAYLTARGIDGARVASDGFGFTKPLVANSSAANMAKNRRIDFIVE